MSLDESEESSDDDEDSQDEDRNYVDIRPRNLMYSTSISGRDKGIIGLKKMRKKKLSKLESKHRQPVIRIVKNVLLRSCKVFMPEDGEELLFQVANHVGFQSAS